MDIFTLYCILVIGMGLCFLGFGGINVLYMRRATRDPEVYEGPMVSILVPARNEEGRILPCLEGLKKQSYGNYEVILLDDGSTDGTLALLDAAAAGDSRFRVISGAPLPEGWNGKPHALAQLSAAARSDILIFLDADMTPEVDLISWVVTNLSAHRADSLSGYARHPLGSFGEALLSPVFYMPTMNLVPLWRVIKSPNPKVSHAIGQIFAYRRSALEAVGGYTSVRDRINDDICMARRMKSCGFRHIFLDAKEVLSGRLYESLGDAIRGLQRIQLEYFDGSALTLGLIIILLGGMVLAPPLMAVLRLLGGIPVPPMLWTGMLSFLAAWSVVLWDRGQKWYVPFLYPIQFSIMSWVCCSSIIDGTVGRGYRWKNRTIPSLRMRKSA